MSASAIIAKAPPTEATATTAVTTAISRHSIAVLLPRTTSRATTVCRARAGTANTSVAASSTANSP